MPTIRLTKRVVEGQCPGPRDIVLWDTELTGFGCKITPAGRRAYFCYYRTRDGVQRRPAIGTHGRLTVQEAREIARGWLAEAAAGGDPSQDRHGARRAPTVKELCERFVEEHSLRRNKPGTAYNYQRLIERFVLPTLGNRKVASIVPADIEQIHRDLQATPYQANRVLGLLSKMMNLAERWEYRPPNSNPTRHVGRNREGKRERYLSSEEMARLASILAKAESDGSEAMSTIAAIRLLIFTGCRLSEILSLRWEHLDLRHRCLRLPDSKTGAKVVHLNGAAIDILGSLERTASPWVLPGAKEGAHLVNLQKPWRRVRRHAELENLRIHNLRHSFASVAAGLGEGLHMIGKLLGHTQAQTSHRYAHLAADPVRAASERVSEAIVEMMRPERKVG